MSNENELVSFELPYFLSIVFGTMPTKLKLRVEQDNWLNEDSSDKNRKFIAITIAWMTIVTVFLIRDVQASILWNPTQFFSMKVVDIFPNDFYCMRLVHNAEIWIVLVLCLNSSPKLPNIMENFHILGSTRNNSEVSNCWKKLKHQHRNLISLYGMITISPIAFEIFLLLYKTNNFDLQQFLQGTLHCIPLTINLQFCSLCSLFAFQFEHLNEQVSRKGKNGSLTPMSMQQISQKHSEICYLTRQVYKIYEWQLLAETTIVTLTVFLYTYYALNPSNFIWDGYGEVLFCILWILHYAGRFFTTCMSVSKVIFQAEDITQNILLMEDSSYTVNSHNEITSLVNRAQNQNTRFDVCGFFYLEGSLIVSVCRWCISFILILLQFRKPT